MCNTNNAYEVIETLARNFFENPTATLTSSSPIFDDGRPLGIHLLDALDELNWRILRKSHSARAHLCKADILALRKRVQTRRTAERV
jgi:hypothetical protein